MTLIDSALNSENYSNIYSNIVFIDSNINNYQTLISSIQNAEIVLLDSSRDGIEQITEQLSNYSELDSIQIISHGEDGSVQLGNTFLNQNSVTGYVENLQQWGNALSNDGDLLFYGCNLAAGADGFELIERVSQLTQADVAASNDLTGKGGDWQLEVTTGSIEATVALDQATQDSYQGQLNLLTNGSFEANVVDNDRVAFLNAANVAGWQSLNGERLEIWDSGFKGVTSSDGSNHLELDALGRSNLDGIYQDIQTQAGETYTLTFDMRALGTDVNSDNEAVVVEWNGVKTRIDGYRASTPGEWTTITTNVIGTGGNDRILFRESGAVGASNGYGPFLDNISLLPSGQNLLTNGSFEANVVDNDRVAFLNAATVAGWQSLNGERLEIWDSGHRGVTSSEGSNHLELDALGRSNLDGIYQDIQTQAGETYTLTFDMRALGTDVNSDNEAVVVEWNGVKTRIDGYRAATPGEWTTITTNVIGTGGNDRILFRESGAASASNGYGPFLDNMSLLPSGPNLLTNGSFEAYNVDNDRPRPLVEDNVAGWQSLNGELIELWDSGHRGVTSSEGSNHLELDYLGRSNLDGIYQDIQTQAGESYTLTFDTRAIGTDVNRASETVVVEWNGVKTKIDGYHAATAGAWTTITTNVIGTGGRDRILFRESGEPGASNGYGAFLDNISLQPSGPNLLTNGSFEANAVDNDRVNAANAANVAGWQSLNGERLELWDSGHRGVTSSEGSNHLELDYLGRNNLDGLYQEIQTQAGKTYTLTFDMRALGTDVNSASETVVVEWNGVKTKIDGYRAATAGAWTTITTTVVGTGGNDRILFRESGESGASNGYGPFLDNISLRAKSDFLPIAPRPNGLGFTRETLVSGLDTPIAFTYADDGRIFVTEKAGRVKIVENGAVVSTFIDINEEVNSYWDRGLMGVALDPDFENNGWVYLSFSVDLEPETPDRPAFNSEAGGRLIKVQASSTDPNVADLSTRTTVLDGHQMVSATHAVGDVDFDNDGNLIFSWGDGGFSDQFRLEAQDPDSKQGKFFRVDPDTGFGIPENPYYDPANPDSVRSKVWATGVRNPWRWTVDRPTGDVYFGEVTDGGPEEANVIRADATEPEQLNFGWPYFEGDNRTRYGTVPDNFVYEGAYIELPHTGGYDAITGGAVYRGTAYADIYDGRYFFANFGQNALYTADAEGNFQQFGNFGDYSSPVDIQLAPNGTIQYLSLFDGALYQLNYDPNNGQALIPNAKATASVTAGTGPLTVDFSSAGSNSPNSDVISYEWDFDTDGTVDSTAANPSFTYNALGTQTATLTVRDDVGGVDTTQVEITITNSQPNDGNLAIGKTTFQSSTAAGAIASRAVDGNTDATFANGSVAATAVEDKAFWEIDLGAVYDLSSVQLFIGNQPLSNYYVLVSESEFTGGNLSALLEEDDVWAYNNENEVADETTVSIGQLGRYLRVQLAETDFLSLAEVKIFGTPIV